MVPNDGESTSVDPEDIARELQRIVEVFRSKARPSQRKVLPKYDEHIVCYLDLLGFRQIVTTMGVREARREIAELERLIGDLAQPYPGAEEEPEAESEGIRVNYFSDCMCFSMSLATRSANDYLDRVFWFLLHVMQVQGELVWNGRLIRGGIVTDRHYSSGRLIFSRAQICAYDIETKRAIYPRIVVDESVLEGIARVLKKSGNVYEDGFQGLRADVEVLSKLFMKQDDAEYFVNYLEFWRELDSEHDIRPFFNRHRDMIVKGLQANEKIRAKYVWLANYHNFYISRRFPKETGLMIKIYRYPCIRF